MTALLTRPCSHCGAPITRPARSFRQVRWPYCSQTCSELGQAERFGSERRAPRGGSVLVVGTRADGERVVLAECRRAWAEQLAERFRQSLEDYTAITVEEYCVCD